jgi:ribosome-associated protein
MIEQDRPSKTQIKKQMHELQELGERLAALKAEHLDGMELPEDLRAALEEARRVTGRESRRRHLQYIGRLMREVDPGPIRAKLAAREGLSHEHAARLHGIERWRERLLEDDTALEELLRERPGTDTQQLRALIRNARAERLDARAERAAERPPKAFRELFRFLRDTLSA